jgi:hypothetical protein
MEAAEEQAARPGVGVQPFELQTQPARLVPERDPIFK